MKTCEGCGVSAEDMPTVAGLPVCESCAELDDFYSNEPIRARLDTDGTARPKTRLLGHVHAGSCVGPGTVQADCLEDETGHRIPL